MKRSIAYLVLGSIMIATPVRLSAQVLQDHWWHVNGAVRAMAIDSANDMLYLAGTFDHIGPALPFGAIVDPISGEPNLTSPLVGRNVDAVISDGVGGWYIGGQFNEVAGEQRYRVARINADGSLHPWAPVVNHNVMTLVLDGDILYIGGVFSSVNGEPRSRLAAISTLDGTVLPWAPDLTGSNISVLMMHGAALYCAGSFSEIEGQARGNLAAFDRYSGGLLPWSPNVDPWVFALAGHADAIYVGGSFTTIGGLPRNWLAAVDTLGGDVLPFDPQPVPTPNTQYNMTGVRALRSSGNILYIGGSFNALFGEDRKSLAAYDVAAGALIPWDPGPDNTVSSIAVQGDTVWAGGNFREIGGQLRYRAAALDKTTGAVLGPAVSIGGPVAAIAVSGASVYLAGGFNSIGGIPKLHFAALDMNTGLATDWSASADSTVRSIAVSDGVVYIGGDFLTINGEPRQRLAALDGITGSLLPLAPPVNGRVRTILAEGNNLFLGGNFTMVNGIPRTAIAKWDISTGTLSVWDPNVLSGHVRSMGIRGSILYFTGLFQQVGGMSAGNLAAVDAMSGQMQPWAASVWPASAAELHVSENEILVTGGFQNVNGWLHPWVVAIDPVTGVVNPFEAELDGLDYNAASTGICHWGKRFVGGFFWIAQGQTRMGLAIYDQETGLLNDWSPDFGIWNPHMYSIRAMGDLVIFSGAFSWVDGKLRTAFVGFRIPDCADIVGGTTVPGTPCDDGDPATSNDVWTNACLCAGELTVSVANPGSQEALRWSYLPDGNIWLEQVADVTLFDAVGRQVASYPRTQLIPTAELSGGAYLVRTGHGRVFRVVGGR